MLARDSKIAVLGCGSIGMRHIQNLRQRGFSTLLAFDPVLENRQRVEYQKLAGSAGDIDEVWEWRPSIVLIASPSNLHAPQAKDAIQRGCHVFVEKPLSHNLDGLVELSREAIHSGAINMVACNMRFHPGPACVKNLLNQGKIGTPISARIQCASYLPKWRPHQDYRTSYSASPEWGGAVLDCIHEIDLALWYLGPASLLASETIPADVIGVKAEGMAELLLRHDSGALSSVHLSYIQRDYRRSCQIVGEQGSIYWDFEMRQVRLYDHSGVVAATYAEPVNWSLNCMYMEEIEHFLSCVDRGEQTCNPIESALKPLQIALKARRGGLKSLCA